MTVIPAPVPSPAPPRDALELREVALRVAGRPVLGPLSLSVGPGEVATVMGPSGCGKSSLLAFICGTQDPAFESRGQVLLGGRDLGPLPPERRQVGILFQDDLLFPHLSVAENLAFGLPPGGGRRQRRQRIEQALAEADLAGFGERDPATLSGGQRARVALLRCLLSAPRALLLDEPFAKLDVALRARFRSFVFQHARAQRLPTLLVTHDPADARAAGGLLLEIGAGAPLPGKSHATPAEPLPAEDAAGKGAAARSGAGPGAG